MLLGGDAGQRGERLTLAPAGEDDEPLVRLLVDVLDLDHDVARHLDIAELLGDREVVDHGAADDGDLALVAGRRVERLLDAVDVGGEGRDDDPAGTLAEQLLEGLPMVRSDGVKPSRSAFVLSDISSITPWLPKCESRAMSVGLPSTGVWSILKSPEWITMPTGVWMASAVVSGMLCATWMNSTLKGPSSTTSPAVISRKSTCSASLCSRSLFLMKPRVSRLP